jgi:hypothetical protein
MDMIGIDDVVKEARKLLFENIRGADKAHG